MNHGPKKWGESETTADARWVSESTEACDVMEVRCYFGHSGGASTGSDSDCFWNIEHAKNRESPPLWWETHGSSVVNLQTSKRRINNFIYKATKSANNLLFHAQTMGQLDAACRFNYSEQSPWEMNKDVIVLSGRSNYAITSIFVCSRLYNVEIFCLFTEKYQTRFFLTEETNTLQTWRRWISVYKLGCWRGESFPVIWLIGGWVRVPLGESGGSQASLRPDRGYSITHDRHKTAILRKETPLLHLTTVEDCTVMHSHLMHNWATTTGRGDGQRQRSIVLFNIMQYFDVDAIWGFWYCPSDSLLDLLLGWGLIWRSREGRGTKGQWVSTSSNARLFIFLL